MDCGRASLLLFAFMVLALHNVRALTPAGTIERTTKQQVLASIPPSNEPTPTGSSQLVLTSPSGKYAVFFLRRETSPGAGGFGSDFCYVQVQEAGVSMWESECTPVSNVNTCTLVFSDAGLEVFDGSRSAWNTDVEDDDAHLETLVLVDRGDMQIRNKDGDLNWKASDNPTISGQNCGALGSPGLSSAKPPFASPIHGGRGPFGQQINNQQGPQQVSQPQAVSPLGLPQQQQQPDEAVAQSPVGLPDENTNEPFSSSSSASSSSLNQPFGVGNHDQLPLVDNTPFDSGCSKTAVIQFKLLIGLFCVFGFLGLH